MLAVEPSKRLVHGALIAQKPQALAATHPDATRAVTEFLLHNVVEHASREKVHEREHER